MKYFFTPLLLLSLTIAQAQTATIKGQLQEADGEAVVFANIALYNSADKSLVKVETSNESGLFQLQGIQPGTYDLTATYVGLPDLQKTAIELKADDLLDLGVLKFNTASVELSEVTVTASRAIVEVKPDRTVFNVEGTINSVGDDALSLLRKAPSVTVDNNDNVSVLGRSGVLVYVDGKRLPLTGDDLSNYLQNLQASQIDRIDIITSPGAKYEAEGNAGIIDIRLKRDKSHGANGSANVTASQGRYGVHNTGLNGNFRNKRMNVFAQLGGAIGKRYDDMKFFSKQNGLILDEEINMVSEFENFNYRIGTDFFLGKNHTLGFLIGGMEAERSENTSDRIELSLQETPTNIDSILIADNTADDQRSNNSFNINYSFRDKERSLNVDLDYGNYERESVRFQPNQYVDATETVNLSQITNSFDTPTDIDIYTGKIDYEQNLFGGRISLGSKLSRVVSDNTFLVYDVSQQGEQQQNNNQSNAFKYTENVYAGYINFARSINEKWQFSAGLRAEQTDAVGNLTAFEVSKQEPPVELNYLSWFPSAGLTWQVAPMHSLALNYGRRINRPDYNVLNPFRNQLSQLSFERGNPILQPEIVNNIELGYTLKYRYNFKVGYSKTTDQITRLISPDAEDPKAGFITWDNLASQTVISANISAPVQIAKWWNAYFNISASHLNNQASYTDSSSTGGQVFYSDSAIVDVQAFTYSIYQQHTFTLPWGLKGEISGYYSGPGIWGGVFEYESNWSLNVGLQRKFLQDQLNVRVSVNDIFYQTGWDGISEFNGLVSEGSGRWDSRRVSLSLNYRFGNQNVKSRKRKTGIEDEAGRVSN
ncbi:MAG: TonB-dependent receptor [Bacteroidota bacterium]